MGGGGPTTVVTNTNPLPDYAQVYVQKYLQEANSLSLGLWPDYPGETYAPQSQDEIDGIAALASASASVSVIASRGETLLRNTYDGLMLNVNPKLVAAFNARRDKLVDIFLRETLPNINRGARMSGRFGGGSHHVMQYIANEKLAEDLMDISLEIFGGDYMTERERRIVALGWGVAYGTEDIRVASFLRQAGLYEREYLQGGYINAYDIWKAEQMASIQRLQVIMNAIRACVGSSSQAMTPYYLPKPMTQIAGIAMAGIGMYASIYGKGRTEPAPRMPEGWTNQGFSNAQAGGPTGPGGQGRPDYTGVAAPTEIPSLGTGVD
jgi:hypothetical protein